MFSVASRSADDIYPKNAAAHAKVTHFYVHHHKIFVHRHYGPLTHSPELMVTKMLDPRSMFGMTCVGCGNDLVAPERSDHLEDRRIRHLWHCSKCRICFEAFLRFPTEAKSVSDLKTTLEISQPMPDFLRAAYENCRHGKPPFALRFLRNGSIGPVQASSNETKQIPHEREISPFRSFPFDFAF